MFIEITEKSENIKVLIPLSKICSISLCNDLTACIEVGIDAKGVSTVILTNELYMEVKKKIQQIAEIV